MPSHWSALKRDPLRAFKYLLNSSRFSNTVPPTVSSCCRCFYGNWICPTDFFALNSVTVSHPRPPPRRPCKSVGGFTPPPVEPLFRLFLCHGVFVRIKAGRPRDRDSRWNTPNATEQLSCPFPFSFAPGQIKFNSKIAGRSRARGVVIGGLPLSRPRNNRVIYEI